MFMLTSGQILIQINTINTIKNTNKFMHGNAISVG